MSRWKNSQYPVDTDYMYRIMPHTYTILFPFWPRLSMLRTLSVTYLEATKWQFWRHVLQNCCWNVQCCFWRSCNCQSCYIPEEPSFRSKSLVQNVLPTTVQGPLRLYHYDGVGLWYRIINCTTSCALLEGCGHNNITIPPFTLEYLLCLLNYCEALCWLESESTYCQNVTFSARLNQKELSIRAIFWGK